VTVVYDLRRKTLPGTTTASPPVSAAKKSCLRKEPATSALPEIPPLRKYLRPREDTELFTITIPRLTPVWRIEELEEQLRRIATVRIPEPLLDMDEDEEMELETPSDPDDIDADPDWVPPTSPPTDTE